MNTYNGICPILAKLSKVLSQKLKGHFFFGGESGTLKTQSRANELARENPPPQADTHCYAKVKACGRTYCRKAELLQRPSIRSSKSEAPRFAASVAPPIRNPCGL